MRASRRKLRDDVQNRSRVTKDQADHQSIGDPVVEPDDQEAPPTFTPLPAKPDR